MNKRLVSRNGFRYLLCTGAFLGGNVCAQSVPEADQENASRAAFFEADQNADQELEWLEIHRVHENELREAGWDETQLMNEFDEDRSGTIDMREYVVVLSSLVSEPNSRQASRNERSVRGPTEDDPLGESATGPHGQREDVVLNAEEVPGHLKDITVDTRETAPAGTDHRQQVSDAQAAEATGPSGESGDQQQASLESAISTPGDMNLSELKQLPVINMEEQKVGQVKDVVRRQDGAEAGIVVSLGGNGGEAKDIFVDLDQFSVTKDAVVWQTPLDQEGLKQLPEYNESLYVSVL